MGTQLIFTVGTNPLPVWVAWYHLSHLSKLKPPSNEVRLVHTKGTMNEKKRLVTHCQGANFLGDISTSPGNPGTVRTDVKVILKGLNPGITDLHVHYTGGTKVMSVETVAALEYNLPNGIRLDTSYLDPRGPNGPTIVDSNGRALVPDTRCNIPADLKRVANLNGFTLAPFVHQYWQHGRPARKNCPPPAILDQQQEAIGRNVLHQMGTGALGTVKSEHFEYAAYVALKDALGNIETHNATRGNYDLFHSVNVRRTGANQTDPHFELDVVAGLGYQIVVISCTLNNEQASIKEKGMEVILRARQLGGDEARAIVLCQGTTQAAKRVQAELHDEVGTAGTPLQVWGTDKWRGLPSKLENYLRGPDLHWK